MFKIEKITSLTIAPPTLSTRLIRRAERARGQITHGQPQIGLIEAGGNNWPASCFFNLLAVAAATSQAAQNSEKRALIQS
jgi:hypothetical protein